MQTAALLNVLAWLKFKLLVHHFRKNAGNLIGLILAFGVMLVGAAVGGGILYFLIRHEEMVGLRDRSLHWMAWILSLLWLLVPLTQVDVQRSLDLNGLRLYPLKKTQFTAAVILDAVVSPIALFALPALIACIVAVTLSWSELLWILLSFALLLACLISIGQAFVLWANKLLTSRRFADFSIIVGVVISLIAVIFNFSVNGLIEFELPVWLDNAWAATLGILKPLVDWTFPGLAARAAVTAVSGATAHALLLYLVLAFQAFVCMLLAGTAARHFYEGEIESGGSTGPNKGVKAALPTSGSIIGTLFQRERTYFFRDPVVKLLFVQTLFGALYFLFMFVVFRMGRLSEAFSAGLSFGHFILMGFAVMLSFTESGVLFNKFGYEGPQFTTILQSPLRRDKILLAKSLFFLVHFGVVNIAVLLSAALLLRPAPAYVLASLLIVIVNTALVDLLGHFMSIRMPYTYRRQGSKMRAVMAQPGCGYSIIYMLAFSVSNIIVAPTTLIIAGGTLVYGWLGLLAATVICGGIVYGAYLLLLPMASQMLLDSEKDLISTLSRSAD